MSGNNRSLLRMEKLIQSALRDFVDYEDRLCGHDEPEPAVRAAQFNEFIRTRYPRLVKEMSPDLCEEYLKKYHYITAPTDKAPYEDWTPLQRYQAARDALREFGWEGGFKGSREAKILAFHHYVGAKHPNSLPDFTEEEARNVIEGRSPEGGSKGYLKYLIGAVCAAALGIAIIPYAIPEEKPSQRPGYRQRGDDGGRPVPQLRDPNQRRWSPPATQPPFPPLLRPQIGPQVGPQIGPLNREEAQDWRQRVDAPVDDGKKNDKDR